MQSRNPGSNLQIANNQPLNSPLSAPKPLSHRQPPVLHHHEITLREPWIAPWAGKRCGEQTLSINYQERHHEHVHHKIVSSAPRERYLTRTIPRKPQIGVPSLQPNTSRQWKAVDSIFPFAAASARLRGTTFIQNRILYVNVMLKNKPSSSRVTAAVKEADGTAGVLAWNDAVDFESTGVFARNRSLRFGY